MDTLERCVVRQALFSLLGASSILLLLISPVIPALCNFSMAEFSEFEYLLLSIWLVITLVFLEKPLVNQLGSVDLMKVNWTGALMFSEKISVQWSAALESRSNCSWHKLNFEQRLSSLKSSHLIHTKSFLTKLMILRFSVRNQLLSLVLRAEISLGLIGPVIKSYSFLAFLVLWAGIW